MSSMAKTAREAMKAKAKRLGSDRPLEKVDSSTFVPPELLNADVKTGLRPISRRAFKKGGKVMGDCNAARADRKPRKSGGKTEATEYANAKVNRNVKAANEEREGKKHIGGMARGGRNQERKSYETRQFLDRMNDQVARDAQAKSEAYLRTPEGEADRQARNAATRAAFLAKKDISKGGMKKGGRAKYATDGSVQVKGKPDPRMQQRMDPSQFDAEMDVSKMPQPKDMYSPEDLKRLERGYKKSGRTGKLSGGTLGSYVKKAGRDIADYSETLGSASPREKKSMKWMERSLKNRKEGLGMAADKLSGRAKVSAGEFGDVLKKGGRVKRASGGQTRAAEMMKSASDTAGVPGARMDFASGQSRFSKSLGMKKGGKAHEDVAADKALIRKMVKPSARTGKQEGGGTKAPVDMEYYLRAKRREDLGDDSVSHAIAESEARKNKAFDEAHGTQELKRGGKAERKGRKTGGGVFSGAGYPHKIPGVVPGGRTARATGGKTKGKTNVNIVIASGKPEQPGMPMPPGMMGKPPGGIPVPVAPPPGVGGPQGAMPMPMPMPMPPGGPAGAPGAGGPPPMARKSGGRISKIASSYKDMTAGSGGGEGRLQKTDIAKRDMRKAGGKVYRSYKDMDAGAGSGKGRLEKTEIASRKH